MRVRAVSDIARTALEFLEGRTGLRTLATALALTAPALLRAQFSANPVIVTLTPADSADVAVITVRNDSPAEQQFRFSLYDFDQDADGGHSFAPVGKNPHSCGSRLSVFPQSAGLLPGEHADVRVRLAPGTVACWGVLMVEQQSRDAQRGIRAGQQIAVKLYGVTPTSTRSGEIGAVSAKQDTGGVHVLFEFRNTGEAPIRPQGSVELRTMKGEVVATAVVEPFSALPGHSRRMPIDFKQHLAAGQYLAVPILDFGTDYLVGGQGQFTVP